MLRCGSPASPLPGTHVADLSLPEIEQRQIEQVFGTGAFPPLARFVQIEADKIPIFKNTAMCYTSGALYTVSQDR
jgi:hypothetical protein